MAQESTGVAAAAQPAVRLEQAWRAITAEERRFIELSLRWRLYKVAAAVALCVVSAGGAAGAWFWSTSEVASQSILTAIRSAKSAPQRLALAIHAAEASPEPAVYNLLQESLQAASNPLFTVSDFDAVLSPDGASLAGWSATGTLLRVWQIPEVTAIRSVLKVPADSRRVLAWGSTGLTAATLGDRRLQLWSEQNGDGASVALDQAPELFAVSGNAAAVLDSNTIVRWWTGNPASAAPFGDVPERGLDIALSRDGSRLAVLSDDGKLYTWVQGTRAREAASASAKIVQFALLEGPGMVLTTAQAGVSVIRADGTRREFPGMFDRAAASYSGAVVATWSIVDRRLLVWNEGKEPAWSFPIEGSIEKLLFNDAGTRLAAIDSNGGVWVYSFDPKELLQRALVTLSDSPPADWQAACTQAVSAQACEDLRRRSEEARGKEYGK